jgi:hypothetical protein
MRREIALSSSMLPSLGLPFLSRLRLPKNRYSHSGSPISRAENVSRAPWPVHRTRGTQEFRIYALSFGTAMGSRNDNSRRRLAADSSAIFTTSKERSQAAKTVWSYEWWVGRDAEYRRRNSRFSLNVSRDIGQQQVA